MRIDNEVIFLQCTWREEKHHMTEKRIITKGTLESRPCPRNIILNLYNKINQYIQRRTEFVFRQELRRQDGKT